MGEAFNILYFRKYKQFDFLSEISRNNMSKVFKVLDTKDSLIKCVKVISGVPIDQLSKINRKINQNLNKENTIFIFESFIYQNELYLVQEFIENGSLLDILTKIGQFNEGQAALVLREILKID